MKTIKDWLMMCAICLIMVSAKAYSQTFNCALPTEREPNQAGVSLPLTRADISEVRLYWGLTTKDYQNEMSSNVCQFTFNDVEFAGKTIYFVYTASDKRPVESRYSSPEQVHTFPEPEPLPLMPPKPPVAIPVKATAGSSSL